MASFSFGHQVPLNIKHFEKEFMADKVHYVRDYLMDRDVFKIRLTRMFNSRNKKLEVPTMAITPGANSFNTVSTTYSNDVWDRWTSSTTDQTTTSTTDVTWTTWVRDSYTYYYDSQTVESGNHTEAVWSIWSDDSTRVVYERSADRIAEELQDQTERIGRAMEGFGVSARRAAESMRRLGNAGVSHEESEQRIKKMKEEKEAAEAKAKELLLDLIGKDQLAVYEETGRVLVKGRKHDYIVQKEGFVQQIQPGKVQDLCIHINKSKYALTDNVVALKLLIEADEERLLKIANKHRLRDVDQLPKAACM